MHLAIVGLGRMGANMARRLRRANIVVSAFNRNEEVTQSLVAEAGVKAALSLQALVEQLPSPRVVWLMLPAGDVVQHTIDALIPLLSADDIVVDGGNSWFKDSLRRAAQLQAHGIHFIDAGVSGGIWGLENGYALMVGGEQAAVAHITPALQALAPAPDKGWLHTGPVGSGHFTKMIHNGIEYGMMQAYAEGFALLQGRKEFNLDLAAIAETWRHGSVVRSWLLDLSAEFLQQDQTLSDVMPVVADSGEGRWTAQEAIEQGIPAPVMSLALMMRFASQGNDEYANKLLAKMRQGFGGHALADHP